jgi:hypothetical protein
VSLLTELDGLPEVRCVAEQPTPVDREEAARQTYVHGRGKSPTRWQRFQAGILCRKGHDPQLHQALPFPFALPYVTCKRCGQRLEPKEA